MQNDTPLQQACSRIGLLIQLLIAVLLLVLVVQSADSRSQFNSETGLFRVAIVGGDSVFGAVHDVGNGFLEVRDPVQVRRNPAGGENELQLVWLAVLGADRSGSLSIPHASVRLIEPLGIGHPIAREIAAKRGRQSASAVSELD